VTAWTNASERLPLLIVIRQENGLVSLQLPDRKVGGAAASVTRLLCPAYVGRDAATGLSTVFLDIYTAAPATLAYSLEVNYFRAFVLKHPPGPPATHRYFGSQAPLTSDHKSKDGSNLLLYSHSLKALGKKDFNENVMR
jgi:hypothetical protein